MTETNRPDVVFKPDSRLQFGPFWSQTWASMFIQMMKELFQHYFVGDGKPGEVRDVELEFSKPHHTSFTSSAFYVDMSIKRKVFHCPHPKCEEYFFSNSDRTLHQAQSDHYAPGTTSRSGGKLYRYNEEGERVEVKGGT